MKDLIVRLEAEEVGPTGMVINSERWTGRSFYAETPAEWLVSEIYAFLWPPFDCADCIGMIQHGCQCAYYEAVSPGVGPEPWRLFMRNLFAKTCRRAH